MAKRSILWQTASQEGSLMSKFMPLVPGTTWIHQQPLHREQAARWAGWFNLIRLYCGEVLAKWYLHFFLWGGVYIHNHNILVLTLNQTHNWRGNHEDWCNHRRGCCISSIAYCHSSWHQVVPGKGRCCVHGCQCESGVGHLRGPGWGEGLKPPLLQRRRLWRELCQDTSQG